MPGAIFGIIWLQHRYHQGSLILSGTKPFLTLLLFHFRITMIIEVLLLVVLLGALLYRCITLLNCLKPKSPYRAWTINAFFDPQNANEPGGSQKALTSGNDWGLSMRSLRSLMGPTISSAVRTTIYGNNPIYGKKPYIRNLRYLQC